MTGFATAEGMTGAALVALPLHCQLHCVNPLIYLLELPFSAASAAIEKKQQIFQNEKEVFSPLSCTGCTEPKSALFISCLDPQCSSAVGFPLSCTVQHPVMPAGGCDAASLCRRSTTRSGLAAGLADALVCIANETRAAVARLDRLGHDQTVSEANQPGSIDR